MKILFIANSISIHTARWISQLSSTGWDISIFPCKNLGRVHKDISNIKVFHSIYDTRENSNNNIYNGIRVPLGSHIIRNFLIKYFSSFYPVYLSKVINKEKPDIIHILDIQNSGYLYLKARKHLKYSPKIITSCWGSDIYYYQKFKNDKEKIKDILKLTDIFHTECERDVLLARKLGYKKKRILTSPAAGGYKINLYKKYKLLLRERKLIMLKGNQGWSGQALIGLKALESCIKTIKEFNYQIAVYSHQKNPIILKEIKKIENKHKIKILIVPSNSSHSDMIKLHGKARISIGIGLSDGLPASLQEAILMGSFPIQTDTSCSNEWIECGKNGYIVSLKNKKDIVKKIRTALTDDSLIKSAAKTNSKIAKEMLDYQRLKQKTIKLYESINNTKHS